MLFQNHRRFISSEEQEIKYIKNNIKPETLLVLARHMTWHHWHQFGLMLLMAGHHIWF